jgi:F5/8 type C domain
MDPTNSLRVRKRLLAEPGSPSSAPLPSNEIDLAARATILYSSEDPHHPIEHLLDGRSGRGATRWSSGRLNTTEEIVIQFDRPEQIKRLVFDAEELLVERNQQLTIEFSTDGGKEWRTALIQEYTFSPGGSTYQREDLRFDLQRVTHIRLIVVPNKGGSGTASLTSIRLFG